MLPPPVIALTFDDGRVAPHQSLRSLTYGDVQYVVVRDMKDGVRRLLEVVEAQKRLRHIDERSDEFDEAFGAFELAFGRPIGREDCEDDVKELRRLLDPFIVKVELPRPNDEPLSCEVVRVQSFQGKRYVLLHRHESETEAFLRGLAEEEDVHVVQPHSKALILMEMTSDETGETRLNNVADPAEFELVSDAFDEAIEADEETDEAGKEAEDE
jgi:hypothetical protein